jgi:hypothetical protein
MSKGHKEVKDFKRSWKDRREDKDERKGKEKEHEQTQIG